MNITQDTPLGAPGVIEWLARQPEIAPLLVQDEDDPGYYDPAKGCIRIKVEQSAIEEINELWYLDLSREREHPPYVSVGLTSINRLPWQKDCVLSELLLFGAGNTVGTICTLLEWLDIKPPKVEEVPA